MKKLSLIRNRQTPRITGVMAVHTDQVLAELVRQFAISHGGVAGLASNQLRYGFFRIRKRFFVYRFNGIWKIILNPEVLEKYGFITYPEEGCLTWPGKIMHPKRFSRITIRYNTIGDSTLRILKCGGREAQIIQHEMDHLDGIQGRPKNRSKHE